MYSGFFTGRALGKVTSCEIVLPVWLNQLQEGFVVKYKRIKRFLPACGNQLPS